MVNIEANKGNVFEGRHIQPPNGVRTDVYLNKKDIFRCPVKRKKINKGFLTTSTS